MRARASDCKTLQLQLGDKIDDLRLDLFVRFRHGRGDEFLEAPIVPDGVFSLARSH